MSAAPSRTPAPSVAPVLVWTVCGVMIFVAAACALRYGRNVPLAEDWLFVAPLTGNEPHLASWLWAQNNEHREPLSRLVLLLLFRVVPDFRAGMLLNIASLGALSAAMIVTARHLRGGVTRIADAFFPVALLHLGNWENLEWAWQFQFVSSALLICTLLLIVAWHREALGPRAAIAAGVCLLLLPLTGASGLVFAVALAPWAVLAALSERRATKALLLSAVGATLVLVGVYFIGYQRATWNPPSPSNRATLATTIKFLAFALGPAAWHSWRLSALVVVGLLAATTIVLLAALVRARGAERTRAVGFVLFAGASAVLALAIGWGRAASVLTSGMPLRYALLSVPTLFASYFIWEIYGAPAARVWVQRGLLAAMLLLIPLNTHEGFRWRNWYVHGMNGVETDLRAGVPIGTMVDRHAEFLMHWSKPRLAAYMRMLREARLGPFAKLRLDDER